MIEKIAFVGSMFSGKTTAANMLVTDRGFAKFAFADPVKMVTADLLNTLNGYLALRGLVMKHSWTFEEIQERKGEPEVRQLLQIVGTELGRILVGYEDVWVDVLINDSRQLKRVVVDDCRYPNEANRLREEGYKIVRILRPELLRQTMLQERYGDRWHDIMKHPSETSLQGYDVDHTIFAKDLDELREGVLNYVQSDETDKGVED